MGLQAQQYVNTPTNQHTCQNRAPSTVTVCRSPQGKVCRTQMPVKTPAAKHEAPSRSRHVRHALEHRGA